MRIGITGNSEIGKQKISAFFEKNYAFHYIDVDSILKDILRKAKFKRKINVGNWKEDPMLLLELRNEIDVKLKNKLSKIDDNETVVIDYTLLEDSFLFDKMDIVLKVTGDVVSNTRDDFSLMVKHRANSMDSVYLSSNYHYKIDLSNDWENGLRDFINFNIFGQEKVTVVVPVFNTLEYLSRCINSIKNQTYQNIEILIINDGSTDESRKMCELISKQDKRIRVINQNNKGLAESRNVGIEEANGEFICFIDSDDYIENSMIETLLKSIKQTNADVCECSFFIHMKNGVVKDVTCEQKGVEIVEDQLDLVNAYSDATILIPAWDKIYRKSSIKDLKFDKGCFKEDADYIYRLCMAGKKFALVPKPFYHYVKRKSSSLTGDKISERLFSLQQWGHKAYEEVLSRGPEYIDAAERILYNSLVHILRNFMRDYKNGALEQGEYKAEIQSVVNDIIDLLLRAQNVSKFRKLNEVLDIINELLEANVLDKESMPSIDIPCVGILWNSLNQELMAEALEVIKKYAQVTDVCCVDLEEQYRSFINDIYLYNHEFEGIPVLKAGSLIDKYDSNTIMILNMIIKVSNYIYFNKTKGFMFEEIAKLKSLIRKMFKAKIRDYAYDNIFHLTVDNDEYEFTDEVCRKYIKEYRGNSDEQ